MEKKQVKKNISVKTLKEIKKETQEYLEGWKRIKADFENYKKGEKKRLEEFAVFVKAGFILQIFPVLDSFDEALKQVPKKEMESDWTKGILKIKEQIEELLKREEIRAIEAEGKEFNPFYHEAVGEAIGKDSDKDKVIRVIQKGYMMGERVIRPSKVYVGK